MSTPEAKVRDPVVKWAKAHGMMHIRMSFRPGVKRGVPDDEFLFKRWDHNGVAAFIEFKRPGKEPTPLQKARISELRMHGIPAAAFDSAAIAISWLAMLAGVHP